MNERSFLFYPKAAACQDDKIGSVLPSPPEEHVRRHLRFNFVIGMLDGGFFGFALGFGSFIAVIPLFVKQLSDSAILIGLIPAIHNFGWLFPQLLTAGWVARARRYKPLVLLMTLHERIPYLGLAAVAWFVAEIDPALAVVLVIVLLSWQGLGGGLAANPWTNMVTKVMPPELHGTFFGTQAAVFNGMAGLSAIAAGWLLEHFAAPFDYTLCFLLTFFMFFISYAFVSLTREHEGPSRAAQPPVALWGQSWGILRRDRNFATFLAVRSLSQFASMAFSFYLIYAVADYGMSETLAGVMTGFLLIAQVVVSPVMGRLGDRWSHRGVMVLGALAAALSSLLAWMAVSVAWFYPVFLLEAVAIIAIWTIPLALTVSFAKAEHERPLYIGLSSTVTAPATILAPVFGGWLADAAGYDATFIASTVCALVMAAVLIFVVREPRRQSMEATPQTGAASGA
jgi:MFS family permease